MPTPIPLDPEATLAIERLVNEHAWLIDHGKADQVAALYTPGARMFGVGPDKLGQAAIGEWADQRAAMTQRRSRHAQSNIRLQPMPGGQVGGTVLLTLYRHDGDGPAPATPLMVAEYDDIYARDDDGAWRFAERRLTILFGG